MKKKAWGRCILVFFAIIFMYLFVVGGLNYVVDPLWNFRHGISIGKFQQTFDERRQKTNWLAHHPYSKDTVLFGNSRVTIFSPEFFPGDIFNYAVGDMLPLEYGPFLRHFVENNRGNPRSVVLGVSLRGTAGQFVNWVKTRRPAPEEYIDQAQRASSRYASLLDYSLFRHSLRCIGNDEATLGAYVRLKDDFFVPTKEAPIPFAEMEKRIRIGIRANSDVFGEGYWYQSDIPDYQEMKQDFPEMDFIVFTTPVSSHVLRVLAKEGRLEDWERWLRELVGEFGGIWHFMDYNTITSNDDYFVDTSHFSTPIAHMVVQRIYGENEEGIPEDFGIYLHSGNIDAYLEEMKKKLQALSEDA